MRTLPQEWAPLMTASSWMDWGCRRFCVLPQSVELVEVTSVCCVGLKWGVLPIVQEKHVPIQTHTRLCDGLLQYLPLSGYWMPSHSMHKHTPFEVCVWVSHTDAMADVSSLSPVSSTQGVLLNWRMKESSWAHVGPKCSTFIMKHW